MCTPRRTLVERFAVRQSPPKTELPANASIRGAKNKYECSLGVTPTATFTGRPVVAAMRATNPPRSRQGHESRQDFQSPMSASGSRLCENVRERRTSRNIFSIAFSRHKLSVRLISEINETETEFLRAI